MNGIGIYISGDLQNLVGRSIGLDWTESGTNTVAFIRLESVQRKLILFSVNADGVDPQFSRRAKHTNRDLTSICNEYFFDWLCFSHLQ